MVWNNLFQAVAQKFDLAYFRANTLSRGTLSILGRAGRSFYRSGATEVAASLAYYVVFSLVPLLLVLIGAASLFVGQEQVLEQVQFLSKDLPPFIQNLIERNIRRVYDLGRLIGLGGALGLLWSASHVFTSLVTHINRAWQQSEPRGMVARRLVGFVVLVIVVSLLLLSLASSALFGLFPRLNVPIYGSLVLYETRLWLVVSDVIPRLLWLGMFLALFRWAPKTHVQWSEALIGAVVVVAGWELTTQAFSWYLTTGLTRYELIYGSLGAVIIFMVWIYLNNLIVLFGAHLSAAAAGNRKNAGTSSKNLESAIVADIH
jgi:membrane protein